MDRRSFDFLYGEICVAVGRRVSRYALWLLVSESDKDDVGRSQKEKQAFFTACIDAFLAQEKEDLSPRARRRLGRRMGKFDPRYPTPEELFSRLATQGRS